MKTIGGGALLHGSTAPSTELGSWSWWSYKQCLYVKTWCKCNGPGCFLFLPVCLCVFLAWAWLSTSRAPGQSTHLSLIMSSPAALKPWPFCHSLPDCSVCSSGWSLLVMQVLPLVLFFFETFGDTFFPVSRSPLPALLTSSHHWPFLTSATLHLTSPRRPRQPLSLLPCTVYNKSPKTCPCVCFWIHKILLQTCYCKHCKQNCQTFGCVSHYPEQQQSHNKLHS